MLNILQSIDQKYSKFACDIIIRHLFETDEKLKFSTKSDFEFLIPCLAHCSLNNYTKQIPKIFQVILVRINESLYNEYTNDEYNNYLSIIFSSLVSFIENMDESSQDNDEFINNIIDILNTAFNNNSDEFKLNEKFFLKSKTWEIGIRSILMCLVFLFKKKYYYGIDNLTNLFQFGYVNYDVYNLQNLKYYFSLYGNGKDKEKQDICKKQFHKLFRYIIYYFFQNDVSSDKRIFLYQTIQFIKAFEDGLMNETNNSLNEKKSWCFIGSNFIDLMYGLKMVSKSRLSYYEYPIDIVLKIFSNNIFIKQLDLIDNIELHIGLMFKLFSRSKIRNDSKWLQIFKKYICYIIYQKSNPDSTIIIHILNCSSKFSTENPIILYSILPLIIQEMNKLSFENITQSISFAWNNTLWNLIQYSRIENDTILTRNLYNVFDTLVENDILDKQSFLNNKRFLNEMFQLNQTLIIGNIKAYFIRLIQILEFIDFEESKKNNSIIRSIFLSLSFSQYINPNIVEEIKSFNFIEKIIKIICSPNINNSEHGIFIGFLLELTNTTLFRNNNALISKVNEYLNYLKTKEDVNIILAHMIDILNFNLKGNSISTEQINILLSKYKNIHHYFLKNIIITFGEEEGNNFKLIARGKNGISSFTISEIIPKTKVPIDDIENSVYIPLEKLQIDKKYKPFQEYIKNDMIPKENKGYHFLFALGLDKNIPYYLNENFDYYINKYDMINDKLKVLIQIASINNESNCLSISDDDKSNCFCQFVSNLGNKFETKYFQFQFNIKKVQSNILIIFNETKCNFKCFDFDSNSNYRLIISVLPCYQSYKTQALLYKVKILHICDKTIIFPFSNSYYKIISADSLRSIITMICFFAEFNTNHILNSYNQRSSILSELREKIEEL